MSSPESAMRSLQDQGKSDCAEQNRCLAVSVHVMTMCARHRICCIDYRARTGHLPVKDQEGANDARHRA